MDYRYATLIKKYIRQCHCPWKTPRDYQQQSSRRRYIPQIVYNAPQIYVQKIKIGKNRDGQRLNHLRFADNVVFISDAINQGYKMLED